MERKAYNVGRGEADSHGACGYRDVADTLDLGHTLPGTSAEKRVDVTQCRITCSTRTKPQVDLPEVFIANQW